MAIVPIYEFPHEVLRKKARKVKKLDDSIHRIADDLIDTMQNAQGVGLAANQIGILKRIISFSGLHVCIHFFALPPCCKIPEFNLSR